MWELTDKVFSLPVFLITIASLLFYIYFKVIVYSYWKKHQVPHDNPRMLIGTLHKQLLLQQMSMANSCRKSYETFQQHPFHGLYIFYNPVVMINDLELIKDILITNFHHFTDRGLFYNEKLDPLTGNLFLLSGDKWRAMRIKFTAVFTPSRFKSMFPLLLEVANEVINVTHESLLEVDELDLKDLVSRYTTDTTFSLAFGFNSNTVRNPTSDIRRYANLIIENRPVINTIAICAREILNVFRIPFFNRKGSRFFIKLFNDMIDKRKKEKQSRNDFLNVLIELMEKEQVIENDSDVLGDPDNRAQAARKLTLLEAAAQAFLFFLAGYETTSSTLTHCLHELSLNPHIQEEVHKEIDEFLATPEASNKENFMKLKYLDMVWKETLRKHPILPTVNRECVKDYKVPNTNYVIPKGMRLIISISGIQRNPKYYPDPEKFDPTRFSKENAATMNSCQYLPFGLGPRYCIGKRLGDLQGKLILFKLLCDYQFSTCERTPKTVVYSINSFLQTPGGPVYLRMKKRY